jgi:phosphoribosylformylglycinamidine synthase
MILVCCVLCGLGKPLNVSHNHVSSHCFIAQEKLGRDPTDVECFDMGQSNSEHSRHWFFGGKMVIDGEEKPETLFQMVKATLPKDVPNNSIIAFHDNSSSIRGYECTALHPTRVDRAAPVVTGKQLLHPILTAETHNFPSGVAPFAGAETGTGGRLRDVMATGRGAYPVAGIAAYCVGNLQIPGYPLPWEDTSFVYPSNLASPLTIQIDASDGASDYGNKYGEPVIAGYTRAFGQRLPNGERFEWVKPIMFSAGVGYLDGRHTAKEEPQKGMLVVKVGGPAYRIGIGGGAASSRVQSSENAALDFDAVQRGDAEMENRMNRLMRACCDLGDHNPIVSVHDQGAGGNGNVLKEIVEPAGASYDIRKVKFEGVLRASKRASYSSSPSHSTLLSKHRSMSETIPCLCWRFGELNTRRTMLF